jgi:hypothetical protein
MGRFSQLSFIVERRYPGQHPAFPILQRCPAAGRNMGHLLRNAGFLDRAGAVAAADDGRRAVLPNSLAMANVPSANFGNATSAPLSAILVSFS